MSWSKLYTTMYQNNHSLALGQMSLDRLSLEHMSLEHLSLEQKPLEKTLPSGQLSSGKKSLEGIRAVVFQINVIGGHATREFVIRAKAI